MPDIFAKLNLADRTEILLLSAPASFEAALAARPELRVRRDLEDESAIDFALAFVTTQAEVDRVAGAVGQRARGDAVVWFAYPKASSRRYRCEFNRDSGWAELGRLGFEGVRQVAIDEDWSALRFRRVEYIKTMRRDPTRAMSAEGRARLTKGS